MVNLYSASDNVYIITSLIKTILTNSTNTQFNESNICSVNVK